MRWLAARDTKREKLNWMVGNLERGPGAAFAQTRRALPTPGNKQAFIVLGSMGVRGVCVKVGGLLLL